MPVVLGLQTDRQEPVLGLSRQVLGQANLTTLPLSITVKEML